MGKNKNVEAEQSAPSSPHPTSPRRDDPVAETERRLAGLEKAAVDLNNRIFDNHKWFVTILFSVVAVLLTISGIMSKLDVRDSIKEMENRVNRATTEMEKKVQVVVGDALKKPILQAVTGKDEPLEGTTNLVYGTVPFQIYSVFLKNVGDKRTDPISVTYLLKSGFRNSSRDWDQAPINQRDFGMGFYLRGQGITIAPGQTVNAPQIEIDGDVSQPSPCELEVFYGGEKPLRTRFFIKKE